MVKSNDELRITIHSGEIDPTEQLRERIRIVAGGDSCRDIGDRTNTHPETVRRYLSSGTPSADFVRSVADLYGVSADWLLSGRGCVYRRDQLASMLRAATFPQLLQALGERLGSLDRALTLENGTDLTIARRMAAENARATRRGRETASRHTLNSRST